MQAFVGQTRDKKLIETLNAAGVGEMTVRGEYKPRRALWAYDNGAFRDHTAETPFDDDRFRFELQRFSMSTSVETPAFIILPDVVADARATLGQALYWIEQVRNFIWPRSAPLALALQNGMAPEDVRPFLPLVDVLFVGGSVEWKWQTAAQWCQFAHEHGKRCHIGRVGTPRLVERAAAAGADSIDSCFPLWSSEQMSAFLAAVRRANTPRGQLAFNFAA